MSTWFDVSKEGLRKLVDSRPKSFAIFELIQNGIDENSTRVDVKLTAVPGKPRAYLTVKDDNPAGFADLTHAYTLYAESNKKSDPTKRGRYNLGEKLVLALCDEAAISSTTGTIVFNADGKREKTRFRTVTGSEFRATIRMTREELAEVEDSISLLIPPQGVTVTFNGSTIPHRAPVTSFETSLPTLISDDEGVLRRTVRKVIVNVYEPIRREKAMIYELGIPVVETGDKYHIDVQQKVPLNADRDNVSPSYLRELRTAVLNNTFTRLSEDDAKTAWVRNALEDPEVSDLAVRTVITKSYGNKAVSFDPSDMEANKTAMASGYTVIAGGAFNRATWENIRQAQALIPSSVDFATPKPYSDDPNATPVEVIPESEYTFGMMDVAILAKRLAKELMGVAVKVRIVRAPNFSAAYGTRTLDFSLQRLGRDWFDLTNNMPKIIDLMIHEFGHEYESDHLSTAYYHALTKLAGKAVAAALRSPELFDTHTAIRS